MNYLAHLYLAGSEEDLIIGNFIADHIKGNGIDRFGEGIRKGIFMHRSIDQYTDTHPVVKQSIMRLRPVYRKYSGVIVDMFYDHFIAIHWNQYSDLSLQQFTSNMYSVLFRNHELLPQRSQRILSFMSANDWLSSYAKLEGLQQALTGMSHRTTFISKMEHAVNDLQRDYNYYQEEFFEYFPQLCGYVKREFVSKT